MIAHGRGSHRFYVRYVPEEDLWLKLDFVSKIDFGQFQEYPTTLERPCLQRRRRDGSLSRLDPQDEAWIVLLHLLLDKDKIPEARRELAVAAAEIVTEFDMVPSTVRVLTKHRTTTRHLLEAVRKHDLELAGGIADDLRRHWDPRRLLAINATRIVRRFRRKLSGLTIGRMGPGRVVAILGPDGAGKTTLAQGLVESLPMPSRSVYMGLWRTGRWDNVIRLVPGARLSRSLLRALAASLALSYHKLRGRLVVVDRFLYDAFTGEDNSAGGRILALVASRMAPRLDLALVLDAPGITMFARKGEDSPALLERRRQAYLNLGNLVPNLVVLDATELADAVRRRASAEIWTRCLIRRQGRHRDVAGSSIPQE